MTSINWSAVSDLSSQVIYPSEDVAYQCAALSLTGSPPVSRNSKECEHFYLTFFIEATSKETINTIQHANLKIMESGNGYTVTGSLTDWINLVRRSDCYISKTIYAHIRDAGLSQLLEDT